MLGWLVDHDIDPHIPVWDQSKVAAEGKFTRADFTYDKARDLYICPGGKQLKTSGTAHDGTTIKYIAKHSDCAACQLKPRCTTGPGRRLSRDVHQDARDYTQSLMESEPYWESCTERKKIETLFGEAKQILSMVRLRLRGLTGARDEFLLTATVQNLKRLANHTTRPPPLPADGLINDKRLKPRKPIKPNRLSTTAQAATKRPLLPQADTETRFRSDFFDSLSHFQTHSGTRMLQCTRHR